MNSRERVFATPAGQPVDHLPAMPITMMFAADVGAGCELVRDTPEVNLFAFMRYAREDKPESLSRRAGAA